MKKADLITKRRKADNHYWCTECDRAHQNDSQTGKDHVEFKQECMHDCHHAIQYRNAIGHCVVCEARYEPRTGNWRQKGDSHKEPCKHTFGLNPQGTCANCGAEVRE